MKAELFSIKCNPSKVCTESEQEQYVIGYVTKEDAYVLSGEEAERFVQNVSEPPLIEYLIFSGSMAMLTLEAYGLRQTRQYEGLDITGYLKRVREFLQRQTGCDDEVTDKCYAVFVELCQYIKYRFYHVQAKKYDDVEMLKKYLDEHLQESISLARCGEIISLSPSQAARRFRKVYGMSPYTYLNEKRIQVAMELLCNTSMNNQKISETVGFQDQYYFSRYFKRKCGYSPHEYRNKIKSEL